MDNKEKKELLRDWLKELMPEWLKADQEYKDLFSRITESLGFNEFYYPEWGGEEGTLDTVNSHFDVEFDSALEIVDLFEKYLPVQRGGVFCVKSDLKHIVKYWEVHSYFEFIEVELISRRCKQLSRSSEMVLLEDLYFEVAQALEYIPSEVFFVSREWRELRYKALKKHGGKCQLCGKARKDGIKLHVDHIKPRSKYPALSLDLDNLQVLCEDCNLGKSNKDDTDWRGEK